MTKKYFIKNLTSTGTINVSDAPLGTGGEGSVYSVISHDVSDLPEANTLVAKLYHEKNDKLRRQKVVEMIKSPPDNDNVCWPLAIVFDEGQNFCGYIMAKFDSSGYRPWAELSHMTDRKKLVPDFDVKYAITAARNLAVAVNSVNASGHCLGDINESNALIAVNANVMIVDTDSAQIQMENGEILPCTVGKPEYTAPEISHGKLVDNPRTFQTEVFAVAVMIFQMLSGGAHPTDSKYLKNDDPPSVTDKIRLGAFTSLGVKSKDFKALDRIATEAIPSQLRKALVLSLNLDVSKRLSMSKLIAVFDDVLNNLKHCNKVKQHWYDARDGGCGWCAHVNNGQLDPWSDTIKKSVQKKIAAQSSLPSLTFNDSNSAATGPKRAPAKVAGSGVANSQSGYGQSVSSYNFNSQGSPASGGYAPSVQQNVNVSQSSQQSVSQQNYVHDFDDDNNFGYPSKVRGKTVLTYGDGTHRVRPPLGQLFRTQPKLAISCFFDEVPDLIKFWAPRKRRPPVIWTNAVVFVLTFGIATLWWLLLPSIFAQVSGEFEQRAMLEYVLRISSVGSSLIFGLILFIGGIVKTVKYKHTNVDREKPVKTIFRSLITSVFYGFSFILIVVLCVVWNLIKLLLNVVKQNR